ncbi:phosphatase PAP2 family protein [Providencia vermicola]|uniref:Phosphatase PAP2 family protein n=1 Tax=Providencia stuartii TaxID=588 RepID=A0AAI9HX08_PROST|nr:MULTISPECIES: phosphatase PAP2 family protein [unclassified Providencia]ELR5034204.1 phosphatase PAP2 family protein [Providencia stuartii]ELR5045402.1 phosphatase PAP2 family protein [Providencia rettgeri]MCR4180664.1 phosphatase PAP2 family protein [Providencia vermicola]MTB39681.1 inositol phosphorylceramide synthase [Providencia sp. wls1949]MTC07601.1 inositol phosphorylceramide synthase [Providencia sp. wls1948]WBA57504.1 phosphatase PAP2 family protein [Providencia sp. 21OH12SH02B-Pr
MNFKHILLRLLYCLLGWGTVGIIYQFTGEIDENATLLAPSWVDNAIPYNVEAIWLYLSFFVFIPLGYLCSSLSQARRLMFAMQLCALISGVIYLFFPTTMSYPPIECLSLAGHALCHLMSIDSPQNLLPSLHVSLTLVVLNALWSSQQIIRTTIYLLWAIAICASVLILKRHLFIDVVTGALTAISVLYIVRFAQPAVCLWRKAK